MRQSALLEVRTERLVLRRHRLEDVPAIVLACQDPDVPRFMPEVSTPYGEQDARRFLASVDRAWRESDERTFAIAGADDVYLGSVSVALREGGNVGYMKKQVRPPGAYASTRNASHIGAEQNHLLPCSA